MIRININMIFYTQVKHSPTKTIYIKYYLKKKKKCLCVWISSVTHTNDPHKRHKRTAALPEKRHVDDVNGHDDGEGPRGHGAVRLLDLPERLQQTAWKWY